MIEKFVKRGLYKTIDFLTKIGYKEENISLNLTFKEYSALTSFNLKEYSKVYAGLDCEHFCEKALAFCECYEQSLIFLRNYSLLVKNSKIEQVKNYLKEKDEFLLYLEAIVNKNDQNILKAVIRKNEFFWEAYELLKDQINLETSFGKSISNIFGMFIFCNNHKKTEYEMDYSNLNLAAATFYNMKDYKKSEEIFEKIVSKSVFDLDYLDLYSNILYLNRNFNLGFLAQKMLKINKYRPETHITIGNYCSLKKEHAKAIESFLRAIELSPKYSISYTLIGHEYMEMKNIMNAIKFYTKSIKVNPEDYRSWFGMAQAYSSLRMYEYSLIFFKKSVEMRPEDAFLWINMGQTFSKLKKEEALKCFSKAVSLNEIEGILYAADFHKNAKKYTEAVKLYEKYVDKKGKEFKRISSFLNEYFTKVGNKKKAGYYESLC